MTTTSRTFTFSRTARWLSAIAVALLARAALLAALGALIIVFVIDEIAETLIYTMAAVLALFAV
jgi:hypothetical protein